MGTEGIGTDVRLMRLSAEDNVVVVLARVEFGERLRIDGRLVEMGATLPLGHKIAARQIAAGERVIKYGVPIGVATESILAGAHVHTHNLRSDYLPARVAELDRRSTLPPAGLAARGGSGCGAESQEGC